MSINGEAVYDYVGDLLSDSVTRFGVLATHVKLMTQRALLCEDHFQVTATPLDGTGVASL